MRDRFGASHALKSPAHITLQMPFRMDESKERDMGKSLKNFATREMAFKVDLNGFDSFPPRVLFVRIVNHQPLKEFHDRFNESVTKELGLQNKSPFEYHPHMTIATRDLTEDAFNLAWPELSSRTFEGNFLVKSLFLLKHNGKDWDVYQEFQFGH